MNTRLLLCMPLLAATQIAGFQTQKSVKTVLFSLLIYLSVTITVDGQTTGTKHKSARQKDSTALLTLIQDWQTHWRTHDMKAFAQLFHEDGIWVLWTGDVWTGRDTIQKGMDLAHKKVYGNSVQKLELEELTFTGPESAVMRLYSTLMGDVRYPDKVVLSRKILVLTKRAGQWKISWGQNTRFPEFTTIKYATPK